MIPLFYTRSAGQTIAFLDDQAYNERHLQKSPRRAWQAIVGNVLDEVGQHSLRRLTDHLAHSPLTFPHTVMPRVTSILTYDRYLAYSNNTIRQDTIE